MVDETDISREKADYYEQRARQVIKNLQKRHMNGQFVPDRTQALSAVMDMIPPEVVVARGDSISLDQIGFLEEITKRNLNELIDPFKTSPDGNWADDRDARDVIMRESFLADVFVTGTNAITLDGKLVNIDGYGNRVSAMIYGPAKVILVIGANKIVKNVDEALERIRQYAAPVNAKRHYLKHHDENFIDLPCIKTGGCVDCQHEWRICNYTTIIEGAVSRHHGRINVVLVGEELGI